MWVLARDAKTTNECIPRARWGVSVFHEALCLFEFVRFEKCPCENGVGFLSGGDFVGGEL